jgi:hypothetical protein
MKLKPQTMKLSETTTKILENFSSINQSIFVKSGSSIRTISVAKNILAEVDVEETFPRNFAIYDLSQFLHGIILHQDADLDFTNENYVVIREGKTRSKYFFADPNVIVVPPEKSIALPSEDVCFLLDTKQLDKIKKAAAIYHLDDLSVVGESGVSKLVVRDKKNDTSNDFSIIVGETDKEFVFNFKVENLKILPGSYEVVISNKLLSRFKNTDYNVTYYIALEPDSTFG